MSAKNIVSSSGSNSSLDATVLSFTGDVCEDGTITIIFMFIAFLTFFVFPIALTYRRVSRLEPKKGRTFNDILEDILVVPFVPTSLENFVLAIYAAWFLMTITIGVTRYYEGRWANDVLAQQGLFNAIASFLGCKGLNMDVIPYQWQAPPASTASSLPGRRRFPWFGKRKPTKTPLEALCEENPLECSADIDFYFSHHLFFGIVWLSFGALQIYLARNGWSNDAKVRRKAHKMFGMFVALPAFFCHICMASIITWRNPVNQTPFISMLYWAMISDAILLAMSGMWYALEHNIKMHIVRMFLCWIQSVVGSGSIRITSWFLWVVGKFFPMETRILIDRGSCQAMAIHGYPQWGIPPTVTGSAEHCFKAVFLNLACTDALIVWLEWIFLCLPIASFDRNDRAATIAKFKLMAILSVVYLVAVFGFDTPDWVIQWVIGVWGFGVKMDSFRMYIASFLDDIPKPAAANNDNLLDDLIEQEGDWHTLQRVAKLAMLRLYIIQPLGDAAVSADDSASTWSTSCTTPLEDGNGQPQEAAPMFDGNEDDAAQNHLLQGCE